MVCPECLQNTPKYHYTAKVGTMQVLRALVSTHLPAIEGPQHS